ncbi:hypothetical protein [Cloacibacterium sp.]|jgi:hypothetical protein|uniref:hypothetical protein n=1 Tax=Cloacibacterium sp. TaxID=1913682 RepID=UPI0035B462A4
MKKLIYITFLLVISFNAKSQVLDSLKLSEKPLEKKYIKFKFSVSSKNNTIYKDNFTGRLYFQNGFDRTAIYNTSNKINYQNDIQKNLSQLNSKFTVNPYQIPKTITNPNGATTPKQAIISGLLKGIAR